MSPSHIVRRTALTALVLIASLALGLRAATPSAQRTPALPEGNVLTPIEAVSEVGLLEQAYGLLEVADHDYKGHRKNAMNQVHAAAKLLGTDIKGKGKGHENQGVSDAQLRQAEGLLQQARSLAVAAKQKKVVSHIDNALKQIDTALKIR